MSDLLAYVDGSSHGNPGPAGVGIVLVDSDGQKHTIAKWIGRQDNNVAEYIALLEALKRAQNARLADIKSFQKNVLSRPPTAIRIGRPRG